MNLALVANSVILSVRNVMVACGLLMTTSTVLNLPRFYE